MVDSGSLYLKAGFASPDQDPSLVSFFSHIDHTLVFLCILLISILVIEVKKCVCASDLHVICHSLTPLHAGSMCKMVPMVYGL